MRSAFFQSFQNDVDAIVGWFQKECQSIRTGRATPALVEDLSVEAYGVRGPLKQYASITISDPKTLLVQLWDGNILKDVERALAQSGRGLSVTASDSRQLRITLPPMSEENRKDFLKVLRQKQENARAQLRQLRDRVRETIQKRERAKEITQDDRYTLLKELDEICADAGRTFEQMVEQKQRDIMTV